jgi:hypothetical protein
VIFLLIVTSGNSGKFFFILIFHPIYLFLSSLHVLEQRSGLGLISTVLLVLSGANETLNSSPSFRPFFAPVSYTDQIGPQSVGPSQERLEKCTRMNSGLLFAGSMRTILIPSEVFIFGLEQ